MEYLTQNQIDKIRVEKVDNIDDLSARVLKDIKECIDIKPKHVYKIYYREILILTSVVKAAKKDDDIVVYIVSGSYNRLPKSWTVQHHGDFNQSLSIKIKEHINNGK